MIRQIIVPFYVKPRHCQPVLLPILDKPTFQIDWILPISDKTAHFAITQRTWLLPFCDKPSFLTAWILPFSDKTPVICLRIVPSTDKPSLEMSPCLAEQHLNQASQLYSKMIIANYYLYWTNLHPQIAWILPILDKPYSVIVFLRSDYYLYWTNLHPQIAWILPLLDKPYSVIMFLRSDYYLYWTN